MSDTHTIELTKGDIEQLKRGDHTTFAKLFKDLFHHVRYYCERIVKDKLEAEDIAVHSFTKYLERTENFNSLNEIKGFIYTTARNACFDYFDKAKARKNYSKQYAYLTPEAVMDEAARFGYEAIMFEQLFAEVVAEVEKLPEQCRKVFKMVVFEKINSEEVAQQLNISPGTVRMHCSNAMKKLRVVFSEKDLIILFLLLFGYSNN